jgi:hypothetical protein
LAAPLHEIEQSPWQVKSQVELPLHDAVELVPSVTLQSDVPGHTALQLALHCIAQVDDPAQLRLQPLVQFATQRVPPEHVHVPASASHAQLPVQTRIDVVSPPSPSIAASVVVDPSPGLPSAAASLVVVASWLTSGLA